MGNHIGYQFEIILRANYKAPPTQSAIESRSAMHCHPMKILMAKEDHRRKAKVVRTCQTKGHGWTVTRKEKRTTENQVERLAYIKYIYRKSQVIGARGRTVQDRVEDYPR